MIETSKYAKFIAVYPEDVLFYDYDYTVVGPEEFLYLQQHAFSNSIENEHKVFRHIYNDIDFKIGVN